MKSIELLDSKVCLDIIALLLPKDKNNVADISLFERFCLLFDSEQYLRESLFFKELIGCISAELGKTVAPNAFLDREAQKKLWCELNGGEFIRAVEPITVKKSEMLLPMLPERSVDLWKTIASCEFDDMEKAFVEISKCNDVDMLCIDMHGFIYSRPDEYHCALSYEKLRRGDALSVEERSALLCWGLCRVLMKRMLSVRIDLSDELEELRHLLALLESRKLSPDIFLVIKEKTDASVLTELCRNAKAKNIFFVLYDKKNMLREILVCVPSNRVV